MDKIDIFQERFGKVYESGWWDMEIIQTDSGTQFNSKEFQEGLSMHGVQLALVTPDHHEINGQVEVTRNFFELSHIQLWCTHGFLTNIYIFH